jgi:hypothetical protein
MLVLSPYIWIAHLYKTALSHLQQCPFISELGEAVEARDFAIEGFMKDYERPM